MLWENARSSSGPNTDRCMPFLDTSGLKVVERLHGWKGRFFQTATMTFADYEFTAGSTIHEHFHPEEEVYEVIAGARAI
jgi:hypothetical protein